MNEIPRNDFAGSLAYALWFWSNSQDVVSGDNLSGSAGSIGIRNSRLELAAENNGWGTTNLAEFGALFVDGRVGIGLGVVNSAPFAAEPFGLDTP